MSDYQVIARRFRPQVFKDVVGQEAIVTTLKNGIKSKRLAHAYLFCGSRGTGKTTLARIFAKALNCQQPTEECEPCNQCASCREIASGASLDVLEIDGASHRGIEDIRQINETVGYAAASGHYKIYIIDEVHMLTKEAFNALLKTLEEPPAKVKFFFATTEPHKVPSTILSRCQRFNLNRIPLPKMMGKLKTIAKTLNIDVEEDALQIIAQQAEGGLRDAESLFDQILAFAEGKITAATVRSIFGLVGQEVYFELDEAGKRGDLAKAFEIAHQVFSQGKDLLHFVDGLIEHLRRLLLIKISPKDIPSNVSDKEKYEASSHLYTKEQCLDLIDYLLEAQNKLRFAPSSRIALEAILLHVLRSHYRLPIEALVRRLTELEQTIGSTAKDSTEEPRNIPTPEPVKTTTATAPAKMPAPAASLSSKPVPTVASKPIAAPAAKKAITSPVISSKSAAPIAHVSEDPTPTAADFGTKKAAAPKPVKPLPPENFKLTKPAHQYDTLFHFAAVELDGRLQRNRY